MKLQNYIACAAGGMVAAFAGYAAVPDGTESPRNAAIYRIEREIQKWPEHWVRKLVEDDYTDGDRTKQVALSLVKFGRDKCGKKPFMQYNPNYVSINIEENMTPKEQDKLEFGISHELTHFVLDDEDGLMSFPGYTGPSKEQLTKIAERAMKLKANADDLEKTRRFFNASDRADLAGVKYQELEYLRNGETLKRLTSLFSRETSFAADYVKSSMPERFGQVEEILRRPVRDYTASYVRIKKLLDGLKDATRKASSKHPDSVDLVNKKAEALLGDTSVTDSVSAYLKDLISRRDEMQSLAGPNFESFWYTSDILDKALRNLARSSTIEGCSKSLDKENRQYAFGADEFIARSAASIANVPNGGVDYYSPGTTDELLGAFSEMRLDGQPVFGSMVDRARFVRKQVKNGQSPQDAWKAAGPLKQSGFSIKGTPEVEYWFPHLKKSYPRRL